MEKIFTIQELPQIAETILLAAEQRHANVIAFYGKMGVGKTTLIKYICQRLNVIDTVQSPTFAIINQYITQSGKPIFHFDLYRLDKLQDALNIGAEEILYSGELCLIEWPELLEPILPESTLSVRIAEIDETTRKIEL